MASELPQYVIEYKYSIITHTVKWMEPENVPFMSSCPLYTGSNYLHYSLIGNIRSPFKAGLTVVLSLFVEEKGTDDFT